MKRVFYGLLVLVYREILMQAIVNMYLITWNTRKNSTFQVFHFQLL